MNIHSAQSEAADSTISRRALSTSDTPGSMSSGSYVGEKQPPPLAANSVLDLDTDDVIASDPVDVSTGENCSPSIELKEEKGSACIPSDGPPDSAVESIIVKHIIVKQDVDTDAKADVNIWSVIFPELASQPIGEEEREANIGESNPPKSHKNLECPDCGKAFSSPEAIQQHIRRVHEPPRKPVFCQYCNKSFRNNKDCRKHERVHTKEKPFSCRYCERPFATLSSRRSHERRLHETPRKKYTCNVCGKIYQLQHRFQKHQDKHTANMGESNPSGSDKKPGCQYCAKPFSSPEAIKQHIRDVHKPPRKPIFCQYCNKSFRSNKDCRKHERVHTKEKPFPCKYCERPFATLSSRRGHERRLHETPRKTYTCNVCGKIYRLQHRFQKHQDKHTGETPRKTYTCNVCGKIYRLQHRFQKHQDKHTENIKESNPSKGDKKPEYSCDVCGKVYQIQSQFQKHKEKHQILALTTSETSSVSNEDPSVPQNTSSNVQGLGEDNRESEVLLNGIDCEQDGNGQNDRLDGTAGGCQLDKTLPEDVIPQTADIGESNPSEIDKKLECQHCSEPFSSHEAIREHISNAHRSVKQIFCQYCNKSFNNNRDCRKHERVHTKEKPFPCKYCGRPFATQSSRKSHERVLHENPRKTYSCTVCGKIYQIQSNLAKHTEKHTTPSQNTTTCKTCSDFHDYPSISKNTSSNVHGSKKDVRYSEHSSNEGDCEQENDGQDDRLEVSPGGCQLGKTSHGDVIPPKVDLCLASWRKAHPSVMVGGLQFYRCCHCSKIYRKVSSLVVHQRRSHNFTGRCSQCGKVFQSKASLLVHQMEHREEETIWQCLYCSEVFTESGEWCTHEEAHKPEDPYRCGFCDQEFESAAERDHHQKCHSRDWQPMKRWKCEHCGVRFSSLIAHKKHKITHSGETIHDHELCGDTIAGRMKVRGHKYNSRQGYLCSYCGRAFHGLSRALMHERTHTSGRQYYCKQCDKAFATSYKYNEHITDVHDRAQTKRASALCHVCGKFFSGQGVLKDHLNIHSGERPYPCRYCSRALHGRRALRWHEAKHCNGSAKQRDRNLRPKNRLCHFCGKGFSDLKGFQDHTRTHTGERPFACRHCSKAFTTKSAKRKHERSIHEAPPKIKLNLVCEICKKSYTTKLHFDNHIKSHAIPKKRYLCNVCGKDYSRKATLDRHMTGNHSGGKKFQCELCERSFIRKDYLTDHQKRKVCSKSD